MFHVQAILATLGVSLRYGMWGADGEEIGCAGVAWLVWIGLGALFSTAFLRVYRYHDVLVKHNGLMWPVVPQVSDGGGEAFWRREGQQRQLSKRQAEPYAVDEMTATRFRNASERWQQQYIFTPAARVKLAAAAVGRYNGNTGNLP